MVYSSHLQDTQARLTKGTTKLPKGTIFTSLQLTISAPRIHKIRLERIELRNQLVVLAQKTPRSGGTKRRPATSTTKTTKTQNNK